VQLSNPDVQWIGMWRPKEERILVVLVNATRSAIQAQVSVGLPSGRRMNRGRDAESLKSWKGPSLELEAESVKLLEFRANTRDVDDWRDSDS
jgi:hypothetical protein